jgi:hypothetical protein
MLTFWTRDLATATLVDQRLAITCLYVDAIVWSLSIPGPQSSTNHILDARVRPKLLF